MAELNSKPWYKSKTIWYNVALGLVAAGNELAPLLDLMDPEPASVLRPLLIVALAVGNTILRIITTKPVAR